MNPKSLKRIVATCVVVALTYACNSGSSGKSESPAPPKSVATAERTSRDILMKRYSTEYCESLARIKLSVDLASEKAYFCGPGGPTPALDKLLDEAGQKYQGPLPVQIQSDKTEDLWSEFLYTWAFFVPLEPSDIKKRPLAEYMTRGLKDAEVELQVTSGEGSKPSSEMLITSTAFQYKLQLLDPSGNPIKPNTRNTEFNLYQVGVSEMGFSEEHMRDATNEDYKFSNMINLAIKYEDPATKLKGTVLVNLLKIRFFNRQFPGTARSATEKIANYMSNAMYHALRQP